MKKRSLALFLSVILLAGLLPVRAAVPGLTGERVEAPAEVRTAAETPAAKAPAVLLEEAPGVLASGKCGDDLTWKLFETGLLRIEGTGTMSTYTTLNEPAPWNSRASSITAVEVAAGVTSIGHCAFYNAPALEYVILPESVSAVWNNAFNGCSKLSDVFYAKASRPNSLIKANNGPLQSAAWHYSYGGGAIVKLVAAAVENGEVLVPVQYAAVGETVTVTVEPDLGYQLKSLTADHGSFEEGTENLIVATEGEFDTVTVTAEFEEKPESELDPESESYIQQYTVLDENGRNGQGIQFIRDPNDHNAAIVMSAANYTGADDNVVVIPDTVKFFGDEVSCRVENIGEAAFAGNDKIGVVYIGQYVNSVSGTSFQNCTKLKQIKVDGKNVSLADQSGVLFSKNGTTLYAYPAAKKGAVYAAPDTTKDIDQVAFWGNTYLKEVTIPDSVTAIGPKILGNCTSLEKLTIPFLGGNIADDKSTLGYLFYTGSITGTTITSNTDVPDSLQEVTVTLGPLNKNAFAAYNNIQRKAGVNGCNSLTKITVGRRTLDTIPDDCFVGCANLKEVRFAELDKPSTTIPGTVTKVGKEAFYGCASIQYMNLGRHVAELGDAAFDGCIGMEAFGVASTNPYFSADKWGVLFNKEKTTLLYYPDNRTWTYYSVPDTVTTLGPCAFHGCGLKGTADNVATAVLSRVKEPGTYRFLAYLYLPRTVDVGSSIKIAGLEKGTNISHCIYRGETESDPARPLFNQIVNGGFKYIVIEDQKLEKIDVRLKPLCAPWTATDLEEYGLHAVAQYENKMLIQMEDYETDCTQTDEHGVQTVTLKYQGKTSEPFQLLRYDPKTQVPYDFGKKEAASEGTQSELLFAAVYGPDNAMLRARPGLNVNGEVLAVVDKAMEEKAEKIALFWLNGETLAPLAEPVPGVSLLPKPAEEPAEPDTPQPQA